MVACTDASRVKAGKETVVLKIVTGEDTFVQRRVEDFFWVCEQLSVLFPGVVLPAPPCADGLAFPSQRSGGVGAYLERCRSVADRFVQRLAVHPELGGAECVVAFLYAQDQVFERAKPRLEAEAGEGISVKLRKEPFQGQSWLEKAAGALTQAMSDKKHRHRVSASRCAEIDEALDKLTHLEGAPPAAPASWTDVDAEMDRQLREQQAASESSAAQRVLDDATEREAEREARCDAARKRCQALGLALERRAEALAKVGAAAKALGRADADERASDVLERLGSRVLDEEQGLDEEARLVVKARLGDATDDARLAARACRAALRRRGDVLAAAGDANGRAARAKTKHARAEAALAQARDRRREAIEASRADIEDARRVSDAFARRPPVVDATLPVAPLNAERTRAIKISDANLDESPLSVALERRDPDVATRARDVVQAACAPIAHRLPEDMACQGGGRVAETITCGAVKARGDSTSEFGGRVADLEAALAAAERNAADARTQAAAANDAQAHAETALLDATRRVARELRAAHAVRAVDLSRDLKAVATQILQRTADERAKWHALSLALTATRAPPEPTYHKKIAPPAPETPEHATASWYDLVADTPNVK